MKIQIKNHGGSKVIVLPKEFLKYNKLKTGDWIDLDDSVKIIKHKIKNGKNEK